MPQSREGPCPRRRRSTDFADYADLWRHVFQRAEMARQNGRLPLLRRLGPGLFGGSDEDPAPATLST
jgi:hypothetical protein